MTDFILISYNLQCIIIIFIEFSEIIKKILKVCPKQSLHEGELGSYN